MYIVVQGKQVNWELGQYKSEGLTNYGQTLYFAYCKELEASTAGFKNKEGLRAALVKAIKQYKHNYWTVQVKHI